VWEIHICHESDPFSAVLHREVRYVVGAILRSFEASERGLGVYSCAKGTLSHGVSVNYTQI
jgi:hypothetical protein